MPDFTLRKTMTFVEDIHHENGPTPAEPDSENGSCDRTELPISERARARTLKLAVFDLKNCQI